MAPSNWVIWGELSRCAICKGESREKGDSKRYCSAQCPGLEVGREGRRETRGGGGGAACPSPREGAGDPGLLVCRAASRAHRRMLEGRWGEEGEHRDGVWLVRGPGRRWHPVLVSDPGAVL